MKRILTIICVMTIAAFSASAQEKEHALEITHGYPGFLFQFEFPWTNSRVEINVSPAATFGMTGIGIRL